MRLHAPSKGWFIASLIIAVIAVVDALSAIPYITAYGIWVAILAYIVLAIGNLVIPAEPAGARLSRGGRPLRAASFQMSARG